MSVLAYVWHCLCGVDEGGEDYGDGVDDRVGKSAWKNRSQRGNRSREREREREGPQALTGKGERSGGMGAGSCPQERFFGAFMCQKATFPNIS